MNHESAVGLFGQSRRLEVLWTQAPGLVAGAPAGGPLRTATSLPLLDADLLLGRRLGEVDVDRLEDPVLAVTARLHGQALGALIRRGDLILADELEHPGVLNARALAVLAAILA